VTEVQNVAGSGVRGLRHLALRVTNLARSQAFYERLFGMKVVWQPDPDNVYLSSGADNLALHQVAASEAGQAHATGSLDHLGFVMDSTDAVDRLFAEASGLGVPIKQAPKRHRDDSYSCYLFDPDGNTVQVLHIPGLSNEG
jgi:catechol 2,3-dioxygenase-like lactoylglutathione lyase family enzyme